MKPEEIIPIVTIFAVGCDQYDHLKPLSEVRNDLDRFRELMCNSEFSIFSESHYKELYNGSSSEFRNLLQDYLFSRSAEQDILILFFSGHGTAIDRDDFGFCMKDSVLHPDLRVILSTSVVKLSEIISTLIVKNVSLVLIVDSCYSGQISKSVPIQSFEIAAQMSKSLVASYGNSFSLITSCTEYEQIQDIGVISRALLDICNQGIENDQQFIDLSNVSQIISERINQHTNGDTNSRIFIPFGPISTLPIAKNVQYVEQPEPLNIYSFTNTYLQLLNTLWNNGKPLHLSPNEILEKTGSQSAYANHSKLSLKHWELLEDFRGGKRTITQRGIDFLQGKISIPKTIIVNKNTKECRAMKGSPEVKVTTETNLLGEESITLSTIPLK